MKKLLLITLFHFTFLNLYINASNKNIEKITYQNFLNQYKNDIDKTIDIFVNYSFQNGYKFSKISFDNSNNRIFIFVNNNVYIYIYRKNSSNTLNKAGKENIINDINDIAYHYYNFSSEYNDKNLRNLSFEKKIIINNFIFYNNIKSNCKKKLDVICQESQEFMNSLFAIKKINNINPQEALFLIDKIKINNDGESNLQDFRKLKNKINERVDGY